MSGPCTPEVYKPRLRMAESINRMDVEELRRTFSQEERLDMWNKLREAAKWYVTECSADLPAEVDRLNKGLIRLAQLKIAYTFREEGVFDDVVATFRREEYEVLRDFEEYKVFDAIPVDEVVEMVARREGRVYDLVVGYYDKQYNILDKKWGPLIGDLAYAISRLYAKRREKIEEAVVRYVRRYGLIQTVREIEEAVRRLVEAGVEREAAYGLVGEGGLEGVEAVAREARRLLEHARELEDAIYQEPRAEAGALRKRLELVKSRGEELLRRYSEAVSRLSELKNEVARAMDRLSSILEGLEGAGAGDARLSKALEAEASSLRRAIKDLSSRGEAIRSTIERLEAERLALRSRVEELERALRGEAPGRVVTSEVARGLENLLVSKLSYKMSRPAAIYNPVEGRSLEVKKWDHREAYELNPAGGAPRGRGVVYKLMRGVLVRRPRVVVEAVTLVHHKAYSARGFDDKPVSLGEVLDLLEERVLEAEKGSYYHLLVVSSPTGFTKPVIDYVSSNEFHKAFVSMHVTLFLLDPVEGVVIHHPLDKAAGLNKWVAEPFLEEEKIGLVVNYVKSKSTVESAVKRSPASPFVLSSEVERGLGVDRVVVRQAFARLESQGYGRVRASDGEEAFFYDLGRVVVG